MFLGLKRRDSLAVSSQAMSNHKIQAACLCKLCRCVCLSAVWQKHSMLTKLWACLFAMMFTLCPRLCMFVHYLLRVPVSFLRVCKNVRVSLSMRHAA